MLVVTMKQHPSASPDGMTFMFQWDYVSTGGLEPETPAVREWLAKAHDYLHATFESTFTDECRELFN